METPPDQRTKAKTSKGKTVGPTVQRHFLLEKLRFFGSLGTGGERFPWRSACSKKELSRAGRFFARLFKKSKTRRLYFFSDAGRFHDPG